MRSKLLNFWVIIVFLILLFLGLFLLKGYRFYNSVFRLSYDQVSTSLKKTPSLCKKLADCELLPGDIIIRRYITERTMSFDELLNPYFTHSAFYLGNGELFEALGTDETPENQIKITKLNESDWLKPDMENFVIIRPKNYSKKLDGIILRLRNIADDPEYVFGLMKEGEKKASCSDVIFKYLADEKIIINLPKTPEIITPDYLFWVIEMNGLDFEIIGHDIHQK